MHGSRHHRIQKGSQNPTVHASHRVVVHFLRVQSHGESSVTGIETTNTEQLPKGRFRDIASSHFLEVLAPRHLLYLTGTWTRVLPGYTFGPIIPGLIVVFAFIHGGY